MTLVDLEHYLNKIKALEQENKDLIRICCKKERTIAKLEECVEFYELGVKAIEQFGLNEHCFLIEQVKKARQILKEVGEK